MSLALRLEEFDLPGGTGGADGIDASDREEGAREKLQADAYAEGYAAGLAAARQEADADAARLNDALADHFLGLSFTYNEARAQMAETLRPLLETMVARLLPEVARVGLPGLIAEAIAPHIEEGAAGPLLVALHPARRPAVERGLRLPEGIDLQLVEDPSLGPDEARIAFAQAECRVDPDSAIADMRAQLNEFYHSEDEERNDG